MRLVDERVPAGSSGDPQEDLEKQLYDYREALVDHQGMRLGVMAVCLVYSAHLVHRMLRRAPPGEKMKTKKELLKLGATAAIGATAWAHYQRLTDDEEAEISY